jgi:hypothetical protein
MQNEIKADFHPEMIRAMFDLGKSKASQVKVFGETGDVFSLQHPETKEVRKWMIIGINREKLGDIAMHMYRDEGFVSEEDFMMFWSKRYPELLNPKMNVFVHTLKPFEE